MRVGVVAGFLTAVALSIAGPAVAHETPAAPTTVAATGGGTTEQPAIGVSATEELKSGASQWRYVLVVVAGTAAGSVALRLGLLLFKRDFRPRAAETVAAAALVFTAVAHFASAPEHWAEGWHLGLFFVASGVLLLGQGVAVWVKPSALAYWSVIASSVLLIALYFLVREFTLPLVDHTDPYLVEELPVKLSELLAAALAVVALVRATALRKRVPALIAT